MGRFDQSNSVDVTLLDGTLSSVDETALLNGSNGFAIETDLGWEIIAAQNAVLVAERTYRLSNLLRGLAGTDADMMDVVPIGARIILLSGPRGIGGGLARVSVSDDLIDTDIELQAFSAGRESEAQSLEYTARHLRPLKPVHGSFDRAAGLATWIRRSRISGDRWTGLDVPLGEAREAYRVDVFDGESLLHSEDVLQSFYTVPEMFIGTATHISVAQVSDLVGAGPDLLISLEA